MQKLNKHLTVLAAALALAACGGGNDDDDTPHFESLVSFGDSLSDVGSYRTPGVAALGGGKYTVNGPDSKLWIERLAAQLSLPAPCAAQTGLQATGDFAALAGPVTNHPGCAAYGQGGSRVSDPIGPWNAALRASPDPATAYTGQLGQLTVPTTTQVATHLAASGGKFNGKELVLVLAGANDVFVNVSAVGTQATPEQAIAAMAAAGTQLATLVKSEIVGKGARHVLVMNLPNISLTPGTVVAEATTPGAQMLTDKLTQTFNAQLQAGLAGVAGVLQADVYTQNTRQIHEPAAFGLSNVSTPACNYSAPGAASFLGSSLFCNTTTVVAGDVSHYLFADTVHPTPYGHQLLADIATTTLRQAGWVE